MAVNSKILFINFAGHVLTCNTFLPDNSLTGLAALVIQHGFDCEIIDLQTPNCIDQIIPKDQLNLPNQILETLSKKQQITTDLFKKYDDVRHSGIQRMIAQQTQELIKKVEDEKIEFVGFKFWAGNGFTPLLNMAKELKSHCPWVKVIAGGPAVRHAEEVFLSVADFFDLVVYGEGELPLLNFLKKESNHDGTIYKSSSGNPIKGPNSYTKDIQTLPMAIHDPTIYPGINGFFKTLVVDESRGCFNKCHFCSHTHFNFTTRKKDPKKVVDELELASTQLGIKYFRFAGSNPPWKYLVQIAQEILRRRLDINYSAFSSLNNIDSKDMPMLAASGLRSLFFGLETGDPFFLKKIFGKNNKTRNHIVETCQAAMSNKIFICTSMIFPGPFENSETRSHSLSLVQEIFSKSNLGSALALPGILVNGSQWLEQMKNFGFEWAPGFSRADYLRKLLTWDMNYLLPRTLCADLGYTLNGKPFPELLDQCSLFLNDIKKSGILTDLDDASYMISHMGRISPELFQNQMMSALVKTDGSALEKMISDINSASGKIDSSKIKAAG